MNKEWLKVREFHKKFEHPESEKPVFLSKERVKVRSKWMYEEIEELAKAVDIVEQADAIIDLIYFALGTMVEMGVSPDAIFDIVHEANMSKLWDDGKPHYNTDGKTIKPENWEDPYTKIKIAIENSNTGNQ